MLAWAGKTVGDGGGRGTVGVGRSDPEAQRHAARASLRHGACPLRYCQSTRLRDECALAGGSWIAGALAGAGWLAGARGGGAAGADVDPRETSQAQQAGERSRSAQHTRGGRASARNRPRAASRGHSRVHWRTGAAARIAVVSRGRRRRRASAQCSRRPRPRAGGGQPRPKRWVRDPRFHRGAAGALGSTHVCLNVLVVVAHCGACSWWWSGTGVGEGEKKEM